MSDSEALPVVSCPVVEKEVGWCVGASAVQNQSQQREREGTLSSGSPENKGGFLQSVREFFFGMVAHEPAMTALKEKAALEHLLFLVVFGDLLGIPIPRPYYSVRLLPYVLPRIDPWKRAMLRERDWTDWAFD
jgi:hypothetical protein